MTLEQMTLILGQAYLLFPNLKLTREVTLAWTNLFAKESIEEFHQALNVAVLQATNGFFPSPGAVGEALHKIRRAHEKYRNPELAWARLIELAQRGVSEECLYKMLAGYPLIAKCIRALTWSAIRLTQEDELCWLRKRFIELYSDLLAGHKLDGQIQALPLGVPGLQRIGNKAQVLLSRAV